MIEVIYKDEKQDAKGEGGVVSIPRNIRQIGLVAGNARIYVEDYVYTFLVRLSGAEPARRGGACTLAVLTGEVRWDEGTSYLFIKGALLAEGADAAPDHIDFSPQVWEGIHEEQKNSFPEQEIVGWFFSAPQISMEATELLTKVHLRDFGGEKVLMLMEPGEREEAFFRYEKGCMTRQSGYYIYYEKNPLMQEYMVRQSARLKEEPAEVIEDEAVKTFRKIIMSKKEGAKKEESPGKGGAAQEEEPRGSLLSYGAVACMLAAVLAVGGSFYRNYQLLQEAQEQEAASMSVQTGAEAAVTPSPGIGQREQISRELTPTPLPSLTPQEETQTISDSAAAQEESSRYYREESDARKARRRELLDQKEQQETISVQREEKTQGEAASGAKEKVSGTPGPTPSALPAPKSQSASLTGDSIHETYVIRPGDTLYQISVEKYGDVEQITQICQLNGLTENQTIYPGQVIVLP